MWPYPGRILAMTLKLVSRPALANALIARLIVLESLATMAWLSISCNGCKRIHWKHEEAVRSGITLFTEKVDFSEMCKRDTHV